MMSGGNVMCADKTIKYDPAKSVLKYQIGDEVNIKQQDYVRLSSAFLSELAQKFVCVGCGDRGIFTSPHNAILLPFSSDVSIGRTQL